MTVNGGGFINAACHHHHGQAGGGPAAALRGYEVRQATSALKAGINADNTDAFAPLARTAHVEAQVRASSPAVVTAKTAWPPTAR